MNPIALGSMLPPPLKNPTWIRLALRRARSKTRSASSEKKSKRKAGNGSVVSSSVCPGDALSLNSLLRVSVSELKAIRREACGDFLATDWQPPTHPRQPKPQKGQPQRKNGKEPNACQNSISWDFCTNHRAFIDACTPYYPIDIHAVKQSEKGMGSL